MSFSEGATITISSSGQEKDSENTNDPESKHEEAKTRPPVNMGLVTNRVYVGNLAWKTSWQDLKDHMRQCGEVVYADVFVDETGKSKGCGIVEYATREEAVRAISTLNDSSLPGTERLIFVREDREDKFSRERSEESRPFQKKNFSGRGSAERGDFSGGWQGRGSYQAAPRDTNSSRAGRQVFVSNLAYTTSWRDLKDYFRKAGNVIRADVLMDSNSNSKGQATVLFETRSEAQHAIEMFNNIEFQGRKISVHEDKYAY